MRRFETAQGHRRKWITPPTTSISPIEGRRRVYAFSYVLGYSRRQYLHFVESQDFATTVREHIRAFEHLGGVAATCLYDNMKVVVSGYDGDEPVYNPRFLAFAAHYGFRPVACRLRRPQTKGKVERPFGYVESSLLGGRTFRSLEHLNETTVWWLAEVADVRVHRQTKARPIDRHAEEQPLLLALAGSGRSTPPRSSTAPSTPRGSWSTVRTSIRSPWRLIGQTRRGAGHRERAGDLRPIVRRGGDVIRSSRGRPRDSAAICKDHEPPRDAQQRSEQLAERFAEFGPAGTRFLEGLLAGSRVTARTRPSAS